MEERRGEEEERKRGEEEWRRGGERRSRGVEERRGREERRGEGDEWRRGEEEWRVCIKFDQNMMLTSCCGLFVADSITVVSVSSCPKALHPHEQGGRPPSQ